jgi:signal transduction histidine kinase
VSPRSSAEAPILRRTRRRLIAWSAGSTLVVLVVLGVAIYAAAATSLAATGTNQLKARLDEMRAATPLAGQTTIANTSGVNITTDPAQPGVVVGGAFSGTIAMVTGAGTPSMTATGGGPATESAVGTGTVSFSVDPALQAAAASGQTVVVETTMGSTPVRVLAGPVGGSGASSAVAVVIGDRTAELDTLRTLLVVLLGGGVLVLGASVVLGYVYAGRALVPIRDSLRRQREFTADASHELRTPLAITRTAVAALRAGRSDPAAVDRALDDLDAGTSRMASLVDDLLLLARTDAEAVELQLGEADLAQAAAEATESFEPLAAARDVRLVLDVQPAPVRGDQARLRQLAGILVDNAVRHSPEGGRVTIVVRPGATLVIEDEGVGIAPADVERVFERFWRAPDAPAGGTGLGLAIARWIAERHGGTIAAANRDGPPGARFTVRLPGT